MYEYLDVFNTSELKPLLKGYNYLGCIGGSKQKRYYIVPEQTSAEDFFEQNQSIIDESLIPIYTKNGICIRQNTSFPIPGFYTISILGGYNSLDQTGLGTHLRLFFLLNNLRKGMREVLGIKYVNVYYEEHISKSSSLYLMLLPVYINSDCTLFDFDLNKYFSEYEFSYTEYKDIIIENNLKMRQYMDKIGLHEKDLLFENKFCGDNKLISIKEYLFLKEQPKGEIEDGYSTESTNHPRVKYEFFDISARSELTPEPLGYRYFDCIGGTKEKRYYLAPEYVPRAYFLEEYESYLDECLAPIYKNDNICIRQDPSFAIPGFYIISPVKHYNSLDQMDITTYLRLFLLLYDIRKGMRDILNIEFVNIYYEEKPKKSCNVHLILLPIYNKENPRLVNFNLSKHFSEHEFCYTKNKKIILENNEKMRRYIENVGLYEKDEIFKNQIQEILSAISDDGKANMVDMSSLLITKKISLKDDTFCDETLGLLDKEEYTSSKFEAKICKKEESNQKLRLLL